MKNVKSQISIVCICSKDDILSMFPNVCILLSVGQCAVKVHFAFQKRKPFQSLPSDAPKPATELHCMVLHCIALCCLVLNCIVLYNIVLHCTVHNAVLSTTLYCMYISMCGIVVYFTVM